MIRKFTKYLFFILLTGCSFTAANAQVGLCPSNLDFEQGDFQGWECRWGTALVTPPPQLPNIGQIPGRHTIITAITAGLDPFGGFPTLCPNGSNVSVKLGNHQTGAQAESISYTYAIPTTLSTFSMLFYYAVVIESAGHPPPQQPRFQARIIDLSTGLPIPCVNFDFIAQTAPGGFQVSPMPGNNGIQVLYKDWTPVSINLNAYIGKTIRLEFVTMDCTQTGHAGYAYVDVGTLCNGAISGNNICPGDTAITLTAPFGFQGYRWYSDLSFGTILSTTQTLYLNPPPAVGTVFPVIIDPYPGFGCVDTLYATVIVGTRPAADAGPDVDICNFQQVQIGAPPNPIYVYEWTPAAQVSNPTASNPFAWTITPNPEEFIVKTTDILTTCIAYDTTYVTSRDVDTAIVLNGSTTYCSPDPSAGILSVNNVLSAVQWYDGTTPIPGATGFTYQPIASGNYWAQVQQNGCTDSTATITFTINPTPVSVAGPDAIICTNNQTIQIGGPPNPAYTYSWTPAGQVSNPAIADPVAWAIGATTTEFIVHTVDPLSGCNSYDTTYITGRVVDTTILLNGSNTYCVGDPTAGILSVPNVLSAVQWYDGVTPIPGATGFTYQPTVSGNYWAQVQQNGCTDSTATFAFSVNPLPMSFAGPDAIICTNNQTIQLGAPGNPAYTYSWTPAGQVSNATIADPIAWAIGATTTEFIVHTIDPLSGCNTYDTTYITGRVVDTTILLNGKNDFCNGDPAGGILSVNNIVAAVQWYDGINPIPGATGYNFQPLISGNYWAQLQQNGCTDSTATIAFGIHAIPVALFTANSDTGCITNHSFVFTNGSGVTDGSTLSYLWKFGDGTTQTVTDAIKSFLTVGNYTVKLIATSSFGCVDSTNNTIVHVLPNGTANFKWDSICTNRPMYFYNLSNEHGSTQVNYNWTFNNGGLGSLLKNPPAVVYSTAGKVDVTLILTALGCENDPDSLTRKVQVNVQKPGITYKTITVPQGSSQFIHVRDSIGTIFNWRPRVHLSKYDTRYTEFFAVDDEKYMIDISDIHTCVTTDTMQILVLKKPGFYLPTAFTPNGDGLNDDVQPYLVGMKGLISFSVFNRWGNLIFKTSTYGKKWNGKFQGVDQNAGVYVWILEFYDSSNKKITERGTITLIR